MEREFFGPHLLLDAFGCDVAKLWNQDIVSQFLTDCVSVAKMKLIMGPFVREWTGKIPDDAGVTGIGVLAESHVSIHTFPLRSGFITFDLYSCNEFDVQAVVDLVERTFTPTKIAFDRIERGVGFSR